jgi:AcrR family transcriptional regulator
MQKQSSSETVPRLLNPTVPADIGVQTQRRRIIDAMVASCAEKTYAATTISDVVSGASISRTTFYKRFGDKRACFDAALESCIEEVKAVIAASVSAADSPPEAVRKSSAAMLELLAAKPALANLLAAEAVAVNPVITARYRALVIPALEALWENQEPGHAQISPDLAFGRMQLLVVSQVASGRTTQLPELQPEVVYLALAPFAGHGEALKQARLAVEDTATNRSLSLGG